jgi:hypothetical protein
MMAVAVFLLITSPFWVCIGLIVWDDHKQRRKCPWGGAGGAGW